MNICLLVEHIFMYIYRRQCKIGFFILLDLKKIKIRICILLNYFPDLDDAHIFVESQIQNGGHRAFIFTKCYNLFLFLRLTQLHS